MHSGRREQLPRSLRETPTSSYAFPRLWRSQGHWQKGSSEWSIAGPTCRILRCPSGGPRPARAGAVCRQSRAYRKRSLVPLGSTDESSRNASSGYSHRLHRRSSRSTPGIDTLNPSRDRRRAKLSRLATSACSNAARSGARCSHPIVVRLLAATSMKSESTNSENSVTTAFCVMSFNSANTASASRLRRSAIPHEGRRYKTFRQDRHTQDQIRCGLSPLSTATAKGTHQMELPKAQP